MGMLGTTGWINNVCLVEAQETNTKAEYLRCSIRENMSGMAGLFFKNPLATPSPGASQSILTALFALALLEVGRDVQNRKDRRVIHTHMFRS